MNTRRVAVVLVVVGAVLVGWTLLGPDSPYEGNVDVESSPIAPERPVRLNRSSVANYAIAIETRLLYNDLLASRGNSLDENDRVVTDCREDSVSEPAPGEFRVRLHCRGGIDDSLRIFQSGTFEYSVTYRITGAATRQVALRDYPFDSDRGFNDCDGDLTCSTPTGGDSS